MTRRQSLRWEFVLLPLVIAGCYATYRQSNSLDTQYLTDDKAVYSWVREQKIRTMVVSNDQNPVPAAPAEMATGGGR